MKKYILPVIGIIVVIALIFTFNLVKVERQNIKIIKSDLVYLTTSNYQDYYLNSLDSTHKIKLTGTGYDSIYRSSDGKSLILSNNYGFVTYNNLGRPQEYYPKSNAFEETREAENNFVAPSSLSEGMFTNKDGEEFIYSFYNNEYLDEEDQEKGPIFRIFNTKSHEISGLELNGEVYSSYYNKHDNSIYYLAELNSGHNDFYASKITLDNNPKIQKLYDINIFDKEHSLTGAIIPTESGMICISCDKENKKIDQYDYKDGNLIKVKSIKQKEATEISTNFRHLEDDLFFDESEDIHTYNLTNNNLSKYQTKGRDYNQAFTFENKKIYYLKQNAIYEIDQGGNESQLVSLPINGSEEIVAFSLSDTYKAK